MKYKINTILVMVASAVLLAACGGGSSTPPSSITSISGSTKDHSEGSGDHTDGGGDHGGNSGGHGGNNSHAGGNTDGNGGNTGGNNGGNGGGTASNGNYSIVAANDLGMHCADRDYQIMSILPPFNVVHSQVIQKGTASSSPKILSDQEVDVFYSAASNPNDPAGANSINTTSSNKAGVFKTNFWQQIVAGKKTLVGSSYGILYPFTIFDLFEPLANDVGIPVPDPAVLPGLAAAQQKTPGVSNPYNINTPQKFDRYDSTLPFFANFPFGATIQGVNWFAADGIPMFPVDDQGRENAYPLMKIAAKDKTGKDLASVDVVLPVASEADCQNCHADPNDAGNGSASSFASVDFDVITAAQAPGPEKLLNAAKINILRLHDAKHGGQYTSSVDGSPAVCDAAADPGDPDCLANQTPIQCSQCHYSPALDLAQVGPIDEPEQGIKGRQQTRHISMSRAMHFTHSKYQFQGQPLFPEMPAPNDPQRTSGPAINNFEFSVLEQTCYQCHPGKRTQCLRGAMFKGGVLCQDCHGNMAQVGDDFSEGLATGAGLDLTKRVPWATEPKCQSCHTGDALTPNHPAGALVSGDGLRLAQAYLPNDASATPITSTASRFAENQSLYRLSGNEDGTGKGHGGVMCEGCHGSTHAIYPNPNPAANDNVASRQLQGHTGAIAECSTCHEDGTLGITLGGPHGMHPVGGTRFANGGHEDIAENNKNACRACHGKNGQGTVLSRVTVDRSFVIKECEGGSLCPGGNEVKNFQVTLTKGTQVSCTLCHENEL